MCLDFKGRRLNLTLVQYILPQSEVVNLKPHGNSHTSDPYFRTSASTLKSIKSSSKYSHPKEIIHQISKEKGGEFLAKSVGQLPRNRQQVYNANKQLKSQDPIHNLILELQNLGECNSHFIRELKLSPEPSVIMASDFQLAELEAFCTNPDYHCVLGIDPTFNLGRFNVTVTTYKQLQLVKSNGEHPTYVGPLFLHYRKTFSCYNSFASGLTGLNKSLTAICSFGTDGEVPLIDAFKQQCPLATHLICFSHCRENIKRKLRDLSIPSSLINEYILEIFGGQSGTTFIEGLADAVSENDFDDKLTSLEDVWNDREQPYTSPPQFFSYFIKNKGNEFKKSMIAPVREKAGLGSPPREYHNNCPECINNVIKMEVKREKSTLDEFCLKMKSLIEQQEDHLVRAVTRRGEYRLHLAFKQFEMEPLEWFELNESFRANHIQKLRGAAHKYMKKLACRDSQDAKSLPKTGNSNTKEVESWRLVSTSDILVPQSIDYALYSQITEHSGIPQATINSILQKAEELISNSNAITTAPVEGVARMVKSTSHPSRPHLVQVYQNGKAVCDENCPMWTSLKICSHCVAVLHCLDRTKDFIAWFTLHSTKVNLTKLSTSNVAQNVGKKPSQNRYSQRKVKPPILSRTLHSAFTSPTINMPFFDIPCASSSSMSSPPTTTINAPFLASSSGTSLGYQQQPTYPNWWSSYPYLPWGAEMPTSVLSHNFALTNSFGNSFHNSTNFDSSFNVACDNTSMPKNGRHTFWVYKLNKRITTCFGCRGKFTRAVDGSLPVAPLDMILKCIESRPYYDRDGTLKEKENANTYYHPNLCCIKSKHKDFQVEDIRLEEDVRCTLEPSHFELLKSVFNFYA